MEAQSLLDVLTRTRRSVALNFPEPIWVKAELNQVNERRGHRYLKLIQKGERDEAIARCDGVVWSKTYRQVLRKRGQSAADVLADGQEVCVQVMVDFSEVWGFKLQVVDWDPAFTIGQLELRRRELVEDLDRRGLLTKNRGKSLPAVVQRLAILTSARAAGYADFVAQLSQNPFGYAFQHTLYDVSVQGENVSPTLANAFAEINARADDYDAVLLLRGGGSKLDLASFDRLGVGEAIASCKLPVLVGIGHEVDETLPDLVAHTSQKTPTALAEFVILRASTFEGRFNQSIRQLARWAQRSTETSLRDLIHDQQQLDASARRIVERKAASLLLFQQQLGNSTDRLLEQATTALSSYEQRVALLDPAKILNRGFVLVQHDGHRVLQAAELSAQQRVTLHFTDDAVAAEII